MPELVNTESGPAKKPRVLSDREFADAFLDSLVPTDPTERVPTDPGDPFWFGGETKPVVPGVATQKTLQRIKTEDFNSDI